MPENRMRAKANFVRRFKPFAFAGPKGARFHFRFSEKRALIRAFRPQEGRFATSRVSVRDAVDVAGSQDVRRAAYGQAVWSCPLDAGVKFAGDNLASDGG